MDINPYQFTAPWTAYEFAHACLAKQSSFNIISMAWTSQLTSEEILASPGEPDTATLHYWLSRFIPYLQPSGPPQAPTVLVFANRAGQEPGLIAGIVQDRDRDGDPIINYAGTSSVILIHPDGKIVLLGSLGRGEESLMVVDTEPDRSS